MFSPSSLPIRQLNRLFVLLFRPKIRPLRSRLQPFIPFAGRFYIGEWYVWRGYLRMRNPFAIHRPSSGSVMHWHSILCPKKVGIKSREIAPNQPQCELMLRIQEKKVGVHSENVNPSQNEGYKEKQKRRKNIWFGNISLKIWFPSTVPFSPLVQQSYGLAQKRVAYSIHEELRFWYDSVWSDYVMWVEIHIQ